MPTHRLIYYSVATMPVSARMLADVIASSVRNNARLKVTGALFFNDPYFVQILEGQRRVISDLFFKIHSDNRHDQICLVEFKPVAQRGFETWVMADLTPAIGKYGSIPDIATLPAKRLLSVLVDLSSRISSVPNRHGPAAAAG